MVEDRNVRRLLSVLLFIAGMFGEMQKYILPGTPVVSSLSK